MKKVCRNVITSMAEHKHKFTAHALLSNTIYSSSPYEGNLLLLTRGTGDSERIGDKIALTKFHISFFTIQSSGYIANVRILIVKDKSPKGTPLTVANVWNSSTPHPYEDFKQAHRSRFSILFDKTFKLRGYYSTQTDTNMFTVQRTFKKPLEIDYSLGNAGNGADIEKNGLRLFILNDAGVLGQATVYSSSTFYYTDI